MVAQVVEEMPAPPTSSVSVEEKADFVVMRLDSDSFTPLNDFVRQLVFCENGASIEHVFINGEMVLRNGEFATVDEAAIRSEVREEVVGFLARQSESELSNDRLAPFLEEIHRRCQTMDVGVERFVQRASLD
jgi:5-methylthioadenosine/S-adenosylhomocysteine deaminase